MATFSLDIEFGRDAELLLSSSALRQRYFFGIELTDQSGNPMTEDAINFYVQAATKELEGYLNLRLTKQIIDEDLSYYLNDYKNWGHIPTTYPCVEPIGLDGLIGNVEQVQYPKDWLKTKTTNDGISYHRQIFLVPVSGTVSSEHIQYSGITPHAGWFGNQSIPYYWRFRYCTGFDKIPEDILNAIGKLATINIFHELGDIILGAGIASQSIGIDGLSQSISTTSSATNAGYGARITGYIDDLKLAMPRLKEKYDGFNLASM